MVRLSSLSRLAAALSVAISCAWLSTVVQAAEPAPQFPYSAFVSTNEASIRSGPGETYYPVLNLKLGDAVEVWRHDPGGWCAVRPPEGAFSWVSADFVEQTGEKTGRIIGNEVNVRVGTKFSDLRDAIQIQLSAGDEVDILESRTLRTGGEETLWYKILPPAGEFRWIAARQLVNHPSQLPRPAQPNLVGDPSRRANESDVRQASFNAPTAAAPSTATPNADVLADLRNLSENASVDDQIDEMELILSHMITAEPTAWSFAELKQRAESLLEKSDSALERVGPELISGSSRFEDIQKRYMSIAQLRQQTSVVDRELAKPAAAPVAQAPPTRPVVAQTSGTAEASAATVVSPAVAGDVDLSRYDGVGRLMIVVDGKPGTPGFALANHFGEIGAYVVAAPGMNLRQYVGLDVGVNGVRGFASSQRIEQITVKRLDVLGSRSAESVGRLRRR